MKKKPASEQIIFLLDIVTRNVKAIIEHEDAMLIQLRTVSDHAIAINVYVHHEDMGLVLGEGGATANAIRRIVWTACKKTDKRVDIGFFTT